MLSNDFIDLDDPSINLYNKKSTKLFKNINRKI
jgi:hypothetical protein